ncbi:hypothetical protein D3C73_1362430 [compost metagenome]
MIAIAAIVVAVTIAAREPMPSPNHRFIIGARATIGTALSAATRVRLPPPQRGQAVAASAIRNPQAEPISMPSTASVKV